MNLYEYRQRASNPNSLAWDLVEVDLELPSYTVREHLTDRERADFAEQFSSLARDINTY